jgi:hypothetical protein
VLLALTALLAWWIAARTPLAPAELAPSPIAQAPELASAVDLAEVDQRETIAVAAPAPAAPEEHAAEPAPPELELISFEEMRPLPPDPVQLGPAVLHLELVDGATEHGLASHVELWRIDAPENDSWTGGDQLQDQAQVPAEGWSFRNLPEGRYRVVCHAQAWGEEAAEVDVAAPFTRFSLSLTLPRAFRVWLDVRDRFGVQVASLALVNENQEYLDAQEPWRNERGLKRAAGVSWSIGRGRWGFRQWSSEAPHPADGFDLGTHYESERGGHRRDVLDYATSDGHRVRVRIPPRRDADLHLVAVALSPAEIEPLVRVPPGFSGQLELEVVGEAVQRDPSLPGGGWERAPVAIRVHSAGLRAVQHTWRAVDGELPGIVLEADP